MQSGYEGMGAVRLQLFEAVRRKLRIMKDKRGFKSRLIPPDRAIPNFQISTEAVAELNHACGRSVSYLDRNMDQSSRTR